MAMQTACSASGASDARRRQPAKANATTPGRNQNSVRRAISAAASVPVSGVACSTNAAATWLRAESAASSAIGTSWSPAISAPSARPAATRRSVARAGRGHAPSASHAIAATPSSSAVWSGKLRVAGEQLEREHGAERCDRPAPPGLRDPVREPEDPGNPGHARELVRMVVRGEDRAVEGEKRGAREGAERPDALAAQEEQTADGQQDLVDDQECRRREVEGKQREAGDLRRIQDRGLDRREKRLPAELEPVPHRQAAGEQLLVAVEVARQEVGVEVEGVQAVGVARRLVRAGHEDAPLQGDERQQDDGRRAERSDVRAKRRHRGSG